MFLLYIYIYIYILERNWREVDHCHSRPNANNYQPFLAYDLLGEVWHRSNAMQPQGEQQDTVRVVLAQIIRGVNVGRQHHYQIGFQ